MVSRTPHALMVSADGFAESVRTTRIIAAAMTNAPEERRRPMTSFLAILEGVFGEGRGDGLAEGDLEFPQERHWNPEDESVGTRELEMFVEVRGLTYRTFRTVVTRKFCILKEHFSVRAVSLLSHYHVAQYDKPPGSGTTLYNVS